MNDGLANSMWELGTRNWELGTAKAQAFIHVISVGVSGGLCFSCSWAGYDLFVYMILFFGIQIEFFGYPFRVEKASAVYLLQCIVVCVLFI